MDHVADMFNTIKTHEMVGQENCEVPASKMIAEILRILKERGYIENYEKVENGRGGFYKLKLAGRINNCGVIKPNFPVKNSEWPKMEQQYIPGVGIGLLIVTTSKGVMTNLEAQEQGLGGRLIAYVY